ncbi:uncharacterized protein LOC142530668 [Primulina tabacum]|uniref:uncharacterized protein LOC142530668 n=1 Tax=Primulina tabacum TaxID=48773 RepID=UPI003F5A0910
MENRFVVPHNRYLLIRYGAHMNVEWCNQSRAIKYLFKYINKGHDGVTASFYKSSDDDSLGKNVDEVNMYYDCRYISPCEAAWRIFGFDIQYRDPHVERLSFHLPNEQNIIFSDSDEISTVLDRPTINQSMFLAWMEANKKYPETRELTYAELPMKFVWKQETREFVPRKQRFSIGRIFYVPPGCGEMYYLRCLLNVNRGATCYDDITFVNSVKYRSFRDACYALGLLNDDKEYIDCIIEGGVFFVYGYGGTGQIFVWKTLSAYLRSKGEIVLNVAFIGIASLLQPGGRTAHSRFAIPFNPNEELTCNIKQESHLAELIVKSKLIIWDEAPMKHWIANLGYGKIGAIGEQNDGYATIDIPDELFIKDCNDSIAAIVESTYPSLDNNFNNNAYFQQRAILAPTLDVVQSINEYMISLNHLEGRLYLSSDKTCQSDKNVDLLNDFHTPEFLNGIRCYGVLNHELNLKVGTPVMLLRNIDHSLGLCNGTRLIVTRLGNHVLEGQILTGSNAGHKVLIPKMSLTPSDPRLHFKFQQRQYPLIISYAITINKSLGQSLSYVGIFLKNPILVMVSCTLLYPELRILRV